MWIKCGFYGYIIHEIKWLATKNSTLDEAIDIIYINVLDQTRYLEVVSHNIYLAICKELLDQPTIHKQL